MSGDLDAVHYDTDDQVTLTWNISPEREQLPRTDAPSNYCPRSPSTIVLSSDSEESEPESSKRVDHPRTGTPLASPEVTSLWGFVINRNSDQLSFDSNEPVGENGDDTPLIGKPFSDRLLFCDSDTNASSDENLSSSTYAGGYSTVVTVSSDDDSSCDDSSSLDEDTSSDENESPYNETCSSRGSDSVEDGPAQ